MEDKKTKSTHMPFRLNILFFIVFLLFSILILRLGLVQIVQGKEFEVQLERSFTVSAPVEAPRGLIYDRFGNLIVDNDLLFTVTFTNRNRTQGELIELANTLHQFIVLEDKEIRDRDMRNLKEYWGVLYSEEFEEKFSLEKAIELDIKDSDVHLERINAITETELNGLTTKEKEVFFIWSEFNLGYNNLPHKVKRGITYEEAAYIMENLENLPGIDIIRDSERVYLYGDTFKSIVGTTGQIPRDEIDFYLANGYERNETVGTSYIEAHYESVLKGRKGELKNVIDLNGNPLKNPEEVLGSRGNDLILTLDMELQQLVQSVVESRVNEFRHSYIGNPDAYVVVMEPHTGDILALVGNDKGNEFGTFKNAYEMGSSIKGATVLAGFDTGVMVPGQVILDRPIQLPRTGNPIRSHANLGYVNHLSALERSSNIYMVEVAMRIVGYIPGVSGTNWGNFYRGYDILRNYYGQLGLGVKTEIDLPNESTGINGGHNPEPGRLLFLSFGQFDTYTPLQLAQYVSTIANDGYRIAPHIVKEIRDPGLSKEELGALSQQIEPRVLNKLALDEYYIDEVKKGFHLVTHGSSGTAARYFQDEPYNVAGKTGTAQVIVNNVAANNQTFVGFAPYDNPEIAISVVVPDISIEQSGVANEIARDVLRLYFKLKEERNGPMNWEEALIEIEEEIPEEA